MIIRRLAFTQWTDRVCTVRNEYSQVFTGDDMNIHHKALIIINIPDVRDKGHFSYNSLALW